MKNAKYSILLICEGVNTEPSYFRDIFRKMRTYGITDTMVTIVPEPKEDLLATDEDDNPHKTKRQKRNIKNPSKRTDHEIESEYKAQPIRFVREAQIELMDKSFDEAWAIFDNDSRNPDHIEKAFQLAGDEKLGMVNIAYSSIAFEHCYLLHFERNAFAFQKSECRLGSKILNCCSGVFAEDCYGAKCVGGYLRKNEFLVDSTKSKASPFGKLEPLLVNAYRNASWLRFNMDRAYSDKPFYALNPYSDVDKLVQRLLGHELNCLWGHFNQTLCFNGIEVTIEVIESFLYASIANYSDSTLILGENDCMILDSQYAMLKGYVRIVLHNGKSYRSPQTDISQYADFCFYCVKIAGVFLYFTNH